MRDHAVQVEANTTMRSRLDGALRTLDKGSVGKSIDPKEGGSYSSSVAWQNPPHAPWQRTIVQWIMRNKIMIRIFLIGMLCGVMMTTAVTLVFAIPANSDHWRMEIWKRGGAAWTFDKNGHWSWKWMVEPIPDTPRAKPVIVPSSQTKVHTEQL